MTTEWELECALHSRFDLLLPDLHGQSYTMRRQVLLSSRRLDLLLERPGHAWIIELKRGSPDVEATSTQLLDYERCWRATYPNSPVSLMAIGMQASEEKIRAFALKRIEYRSVPVHHILDVLSQGVSTELLGECSRLHTDDEGRIRFLLSNFAHTTVPAGMRFGQPWSHDSVFYALIRDGHEPKKPWLKNIYVKLFPQRPNCAVLYHSEWDGRRKDRAPLHLNPRATSWPGDGWLLSELKDRRAVEIAHTDNKGPSREAHNFDHYRIVDWDAFASVIGLRPSLAIQP